MKDEILPRFGMSFFGLPGDGPTRRDLFCVGWPQAALQCLQRVEQDPVRVVKKEERSESMVKELLTEHAMEDNRDEPPSGREQ